jgi:hypothetical protein
MIIHQQKRASGRRVHPSPRAPAGRRVVAAIAAIMTLASLSVSADDSMRAFVKCQEKQDDQARLACYDRLASALLELGPAASLSPAVAGTRPEPPPAGAQAAGPEAEFGAQQARDGALESITAKVIGGFAGWSGDTVFDLDNGQVWQQSNPGRFEYAGSDRAVTIRRAAFGSFLLSPEGLNRSIRVKRIK